MNLQEKFTDLCLHFTKDGTLIESLWQEIEKKYSGKGRHYHNLFHLENMFLELESVKGHITDYKSIAFSVFYHDVIYDASSKSNEEKSASYAAERLQRIGLDNGMISKIEAQILATKSHQKSDDTDTDYLLDADLSILGKDSETYFDYTRKIRKEYAIYPDILYKPGRKKVLKHFLELESIFKTKHFRNEYEQQAKLNLTAELQTL
ncbi:HD domain-containing protein [Chryseobacterium sp. MIQD13]|uniref:HD domain-containing protein n=1 Tax=Chryseobacterium sp. MIQD13 TaxID=3422310 RepID=UPI003D2A97E5